MADKLVKFLITMDKDEDLKKKYLADPEGTARSFSLNEEDVQICAKNDLESMKQRCEAEGADNVQIDCSK
ncbi:hypothetical protein [Aliiglaciecola sp. M165]|uniref:hypothetical protein n=1 Tax=Aliiglaciecola sp. M165 TaxID=2593649 RepID=UPI0011803A74|nr:hypothetical protein [Aliiglaciecola sp. M165]TRY33144.1 hypothetical protein FM019_03935 [Aliiglaciecola sp. M165]